MVKRVGTTFLAACAAMGIAVSAGADERTALGGRIFMDLSYKAHDDNGVTQDDSGAGIDVKRFYLGVTHRYDDMWSVNLTSDFNYVGGDGETQIFVKKAYAEARFSDAATVRVGAADMPWVPFDEHLYGMRYVENTLIDRLGFGTSSDWGVHLLGALPTVGRPAYALSVVNGGGYRNPTRTKRMDVEGRVSLRPLEGLEMAAGFYVGTLGQDTESSPADNTASRADFLATYEAAASRWGVEYFSAKNWPVSSQDRATGYSVWGSVDVADRIAAFARYDLAQPNRDTSPDLRDLYYHLGVDYRVDKNIDLAIAYKTERVENNGAAGTVTTSNAVLSSGPSGKGTYREVGLWTQLEF